MAEKAEKKENKTLEYRGLTFEDVIKWCQENNQIEWLKAECERRKPVEGLTKKGKPKKPRKISMLEVMKNFVEQFRPELIPEKEEKETFRDKVRKL